MKKHTPYFHKMQALGAQFQDRVGFATVNFFSSVEEEARAVRTGVGVFDVAYQVAVEVRGKDAETVLAHALTNDVRKLDNGGAFYSPICNDDGFVLDDLTCFKFDRNWFWLSPTPSRVGVVMSAVAKLIGEQNAIVTNLGYAYGYLSVQGPRSRDVLTKLTNANLSTDDLPYFHFIRGEFAGIPDVVISRTGYSGELGYELFYPSEYGEYVWDTVFEAGSEFGIVPCGMKTMRSLRIEKMYVLNGLDLTDKHDPISAGLGWTVRFNDREFIGKAALQKIKAVGPGRRLCLLEAPSIDVKISTGDLVMDEGQTIGNVTSADPGYTLGRVFAFAYLSIAKAVAGAELKIVPQGGGEPIPVTVHIKAPYDPERHRLRA